MQCHTARQTQLGLVPSLAAAQPWATRADHVDNWRSNWWQAKTRAFGASELCLGLEADEMSALLWRHVGSCVDRPSEQKNPAGSKSRSESTTRCTTSMSRKCACRCSGQADPARPARSLAGPQDALPFRRRTASAPTRQPTVIARQAPFAEWPTAHSKRSLGQLDSARYSVKRRWSQKSMTNHHRRCFNTFMRRKV